MSAPSTKVRVQCGLRTQAQILQKEEGPQLLPRHRRLVIALSYF